MSMRIALCKSMLAGPVSGADEIMVNYATHLHEAGHEVMVVLLYPPAPTDQYYRRLRGAGVEVLCVVETSALYAMLRTVRDLFFSLFFFVCLVPRSFERLRKFWQIVHRMVARLYVRRCRRFFERHSPTLLHVFTPDTGAVLMIRAGHECGIPVLYHEMGTPHYMPALDVYYKELAKVLPLCDEFAALSPLLAEQWTERFPFLRSVSVLPLLMDDCDGLVHMPDSRMRPEETVFGFAARIEEGKGPLTLVEALAELKHGGAAALVRMAGTGPQLQEVKARVRALNLSDACEFVGFYTEPVGRSAFMRSLDVFVLPSLAEGTPNSIIEAMAHGLPVIATEIGGIPDLLSADSGILVPPGDTAALAEAMRRLASDPSLRSAMGRAARERYLRLSSPDAVLPVLQNTYQRLAGARIAPREGTRRAGVHPWEVAAEFYLKFD
jgi:glycosyltransferase involved in cell wall biosynthesis